MTAPKTKVTTIDERFFKALQEMPTVLKDKSNSFTKAKYATLNAVLDAVKPILSKHGLAIYQTTDTTDLGRIVLQTIIRTETTEKVIFALPLLEDLDNKNSAHSLGKAITYIRRYSIVTALCLATEDDDDGNGIQRKKAPVAPPAPKRTIDEARKACLDALAKAGFTPDSSTEELVNGFDDEKLLKEFYSKTIEAMKTDA